MHTTRRSQNGFTLVELSIVLVIIGLIIGAVLTGQQIIQNGRITNALNTIQAYQAQFQTYVQNYGALPGDDTGAPARFGGQVEQGLRNGDGKIDGAFNTDSSTAESRLLWADLRAAGLVKNQLGSDANTAIQPPNPFNGQFGVQNGAFAGSFTTTVLCLSQVPGSASLALDTRLDDGGGNTGTIRAVESGTDAMTGTAIVTYSIEKTYTMCIKM